MTFKTSVSSRLLSLQSISAVVALLSCGVVAPAQDTNAPAAISDLPEALRFPTNTAAFPGVGPISQWKPYPRLWDERRAEFWRNRDRDKGGVVFLGDSITQGWYSLAQDFPSLKTVNRGIGADGTRGVLYRLKEDVLDLDPVAVVLLIGTNDLGNGGDPKDAAANIRAILAALEKHNPRMPVVVCTVTPRKSEYAPKIRQLNADLAEMVRHDHHLSLCDTWSLFAQPDGACKPEEFPDMLHPNKAGYAKWIQALKPLLAKLDLNSKG